MKLYRPINKKSCQQKGETQEISSNNAELNRLIVINSIENSHAFIRKHMKEFNKTKIKERCANDEKKTIFKTIS